MRGLLRGTYLFEDAKKTSQVAGNNEHGLLHHGHQPRHRQGARVRAARWPARRQHIEGVRHIALKAKRLLDVGLEYVFVSMGSDGMIAVHGNDCLLCSPPAVRAIDTVGCGDALVAGVLVGHHRGFELAETCRLAVACGASNAMHPGPGNVSSEEVWRLMEDVNIEIV